MKLIDEYLKKHSILYTRYLVEDGDFRYLNKTPECQEEFRELKESYKGKWYIWMTVDRNGFTSYYILTESPEYYDKYFPDYDYSDMTLCGEYGTLIEAKKSEKAMCARDAIADAKAMKEDMLWRGSSMEDPMKGDSQWDEYIYRKEL